MKKHKSPLKMIEDKSHTHASKNNSVGIVGESQIWDGPLDQEGRPHGLGSSSGSHGMKLKLMDPIYKGGPITQLAKG
jgi:hypothetical protein